MSNKIKKYTAGEEFVNAITHAIGALLSIYAIVLLAVNSRNALEATATAIFGATMFILFQSSTCYHAMVNEKAKKVFQRIDHSAIFLLIAGTYTPILLLVVPFPHSIALLAIVWYLALMGVVFSCITLKFKYLSTTLYLIMGWFTVFLAYSIWKVSPEALWYLLGGGIFYTLGSVFYILKYKFMHSIWHLFVIAGAAMHFLCIMQLLKIA
jgi:hemolysin III